MKFKVYDLSVLKLVLISRTWCFSKIFGYAIVIINIVEKYSKKYLFYSYCLRYDLTRPIRVKLLAFQWKMMLLALKSEDSVVPELCGANFVVPDSSWEMPTCGGWQPPPWLWYMILWILSIVGNVGCLPREPKASQVVIDLACVWILYFDNAF